MSDTITSTATTDEIMIVNAARQLGALAAAGKPVCFVGIGLPSTAANLATRLFEPKPVLIYESGCIGSKPTRLPLSIGDGELAETSDAVVSVPEIFTYWLQAGRVDLGFLGGAQLDKYGNINSTVIGDYRAPKTRLPGAGGAPEIAASAGAVMVIMRQSKRAFVERCDFRSSVGFGDGPGDRERLGLRGGGVQWVITDLGVMQPDPETCVLTVRALHAGVSRQQMTDATGWDVQFAPGVDDSPTAPPSEHELSTLRTLQAQ
jgi:glutaconate CoA-transferase subunit B